MTRVRRVSRVLGVVFALLRERPARVAAAADDEGCQSYKSFTNVASSSSRACADERATRDPRAYHCNSAFQFIDDDAGVSDASRREDMARNDATCIHVARRGRDADDDRDTDDDDGGRETRVDALARELARERARGETETARDDGG